MKNGDIVRLKSSGMVGMIVWRKNNEEIGVNFSHYHMISSMQPSLTRKELFKKVRAMGVDDLYEKKELELENS